MPDDIDALKSDFVLINKSDKSLMMVTDVRCYFDTSIWHTGYLFDEEARKRYVIKPRSICVRKGNWRKVLERSKTLNVMKIFLYDTAVLDSVLWNTICDEQLVEKRYSYTLEQLDSMNWTITYP